MEVTVIIPAFNAERFIYKAISSVLTQKEVSEIIVINDGSTDGTREIVLSIKDKRVRLLEHEKGINRGRSASRNLGVKEARSEFIAFLDADDFYLENRFAQDAETFKQNPSCDGVYNAIGVHFYRLASNQEKVNLELTSLKRPVAADELFDSLLKGDNGHIHLNGLTVKKSLLLNSGLFNESLLVAEDTDIIWRMAIIGNLFPSVLNKPVAIRGVHENNMFNKVDVYELFELVFYEHLYYWSVRRKLARKVVYRFLERIWILIYRKEKSYLWLVWYWLQIIFNTNRHSFAYNTFKYSPVERMFKKLNRFF